MRNQVRFLSLLLHDVVFNHYAALLILNFLLHFFKFLHQV